MTSNPSGNLTEAASPPTQATRSVPLVPVVIGPYQLLQLIGEGGMGQVWLAEQQQPVQRRVALKLIKVGIDTREVVAHFESELQALALMDHPARDLTFIGPRVVRCMDRTLLLTAESG